MKTLLSLFTITMIFTNFAQANGNNADFHPTHHYGNLPCIAAKDPITTDGSKGKIVFLDKHDNLTWAIVPACKISPPISSNSLDPKDLAEKISKMAEASEPRGESVKSASKSPVIQTASVAGAK